MVLGLITLATLNPSESLVIPQPDSAFMRTNRTFRPMVDLTVPNADTPIILSEISESLPLKDIKELMQIGIVYPFRPQLPPKHKFVQ